MSCFNKDFVNSKNTMKELVLTIIVFINCLGTDNGNLGLNNFDDVIITNIGTHKQLLPGSDTYDLDRRNVFTNRNPLENTPKENEWIIEKVYDEIFGETYYRIIEHSTGEYLYASADDYAKDSERRRVFVWTNTTTSPQSHSNFWGHTADWEIIEEETKLGFLIKNVEYSEYMYAAADDLAFDEEHRSVFTWKNYNTLGDEGYWDFGSNFSGEFKSSFRQVIIRGHFEYFACICSFGNSK